MDYGKYHMLRICECDDEDNMDETRTSAVRQSVSLPVRVKAWNDGMGKEIQKQQGTQFYFMKHILYLDVIGYVVLVIVFTIDGLFCIYFRI